MAAAVGAEVARRGEQRRADRRPALAGQRLRGRAQAAALAAGDRRDELGVRAGGRTALVRPRARRRRACPSARAGGTASSTASTASLAASSRLRPLASPAGAFIERDASSTSSTDGRRSGASAATGARRRAARAAPPQTRERARGSRDPRASARPGSRRPRRLREGHAAAGGPPLAILSIRSRGRLADLVGDVGGDERGDDEGDDEEDAHVLGRGLAALLARRSGAPRRRVDRALHADAGLADELLGAFGDVLHDCASCGSDGLTTEGQATFGPGRRERPGAQLGPGTGVPDPHGPG